MNLRDLTLNYFKTFSSQDIERLESLFSRDVYLRDWEISAHGIEDVVRANRGIFDSVDTIEITPVEICETGNITASEIEICINNDQILKVVDILEFNGDGKIAAIRAYKG